MASGSRVRGSVESLWRADAAPDDALEALAYRSNLLGADRSVANYGGGNTSSKVESIDHAGRGRTVLWVKGSGSDLATISASGFTGLRLDEIAPLIERHAMSDDEMVAYLSLCQLDPSMPRASIETLLHAFIPAPHVDHTHPDTIGMIACAIGGEEHARACFGDEAIWVPYIRPGFALAKQVAELVRANPAARLVVLAKHGLVTWGETAEESYRSTIDAINRAAAYVDARRPSMAQSAGLVTDSLRLETLVHVMPAIRGGVSDRAAKILHVDSSPAVASFLAREGAKQLSQVGAACPDHLVHTKRRPLWVDYDQSTDTGEVLRESIKRALDEYQSDEATYFATHAGPDDVAADPCPRVILIPGLGMISVGTSEQRALLSRDLYHRAVEVMDGAAALGGFVSLDDAESFAVEYWPLELYKLRLAPPPAELQGTVALVTGGAGAIGGAIAKRLSEEGAAVVIADLDYAGAENSARALPGAGVGVAMDVTDEDSVKGAFEEAVLAFGGIDFVISNAGIASSAPIEETTLELWERNYDVLARGYFLVSREAALVLRRQQLGGAIVFVASKNGLVAGRNASAYSSAKAAEIHLARCLAEELGPDSIRVNVVNPDAVLTGSKIWDTSWREERALAYGIQPNQLEGHYRARTTLGVNIEPEDVAEGVLFFVSSRRSGKSTGNVLNVDGGVPAAYVR
jgi:rhamnulose-1-phosphate aldolase/alcohol dehydrogenase